MKIYESLQQRLQTQYKALLPIIDNVSDEKLIANPAPGKWSIHDQIAHLTRYQVIFIGRMQQILDAPGVQFGAYKGDEDSEFPAYQLTSLNDLLRSYEVDRAKILALLNRLSNDELALVGVHPKYGNLSILQWAEFFYFARGAPFIQHISIGKRQLIGELFNFFVDTHNYLSRM